MAGRRSVSIETGIPALRLVVEVALVICIALLLGRAIWMLVAPDGVAPVKDTLPAGFSSRETASQTSAQLDMSILYTANPFQLSKATTSAPADVSDIDAPETSLNLTLKGERAGEDGQGVAFILMPDGSQTRVTVGDEVLDGVRVEHVFENKVVIRRNGQLESLFRRDPETLEVTTLQPDNAAGTAVATLRGTASPDLLRSMNFAAVRTDGVRDGYRITPKSDAGPMLAAGLEPGDIIREVNSQLVSELDAEDLQETLLTASVVDFGVEREGEMILVSVTFSGER